MRKNRSKYYNNLNKFYTFIDIISILECLCLYCLLFNFVISNLSYYYFEYSKNYSYNINNLFLL